jgi:hypothetical protein
MQKGDGVDMRTVYKIRSYPTFIFFDEHAELIYRATGEFKTNDFINEGNNALDPAKQFPTLKNKFEIDPSNPTACYDYLRALKRAEMDFDDMLKTYLATQSETQLLSEINWRILANGISDIHSREFKFILKHQSEYAVLASRERVDKKILNTVKEYLFPFVQAKDTASYFNARKSVAAIQTSKVDSLLFEYDISLYERTAQWNAYEETTLHQTEKFVWDDYIKLRDVATVYLNNINHANALEQAIRWTLQSISLHEEYKTDLLCARLYQKINQTNKAKKMVQQAKDFALRFDWDSKDADQLMNELNKK